jgi:hypothetical protein
MKVRFYQLSKRNKSTKLATGEYREVEAYLKDKTSITHPVLLVQTFIGAAYNYFYIPDFNRYYFVSDAASVENMWEIAGTEDYLASFKVEIGLTSANVLYASGSTKSIVDSRIPVKSTVLIGHEYSAIPNMTITEGSGAVIIGLTGKGSFGSYLMKDSGLISELLDGIENWSSFITDNWTFTKQLFFGGSASDCLRSAIAIPLVIGGPDVSSGSAEDLSLGNYPCTDDQGNSIKGYKITKPILSYGDSINIPWQSADWKRVSNYTSIKAYFPFIGIITIPATELQNDSSITYHYSINVTSGDISLEIRGTTSGNKVATASGNCAMNTAYGSTGMDTGRLTSAIATGLGTLVSISAAAATGGVSFAAEAAIGAGIGATALQTVEALGGNGGGSGGLGGGSSQGLDKVVHVFVIQKDLTDTQEHFNPIMGKPYMGVATIGSFAGFVQTDGFQFESNRAYSSEKDMINKLLDTGIYYE